MFSALNKEKHRAKEPNSEENKGMHPKVLSEKKYSGAGPLTNAAGMMTASGSSQNLLGMVAGGGGTQLYNTGSSPFSTQSMKKDSLALTGDMIINPSRYIGGLTSSDGGT